MIDEWNEIARGINKLQKRVWEILAKNNMDIIDSQNWFPSVLRCQGVYINLERFIITDRLRWFAMLEEMFEHGLEIEMFTPDQIPGEYLPMSGLNFIVGDQCWTYHIDYDLDKCIRKMIIGWIKYKKSLEKTQ